MEKLKGLQAVPIQDDNLHLAFIKGALDFLGFTTSSAWLAGTTGHAFIIRITKGVCLSDVEESLVDSYKNGTMSNLGRNLGYDLDYRRLSSVDDRRKAWNDMRVAIDAGHPCYVYYNFCNQMVDRYDDEGFYFAQGFPFANQGQGPISLVESNDGSQFTIIRPAQQDIADDITAVKEGLSFSLGHVDLDPDNHGLKAYDNWIESIRTRDNTGTWRAARGWATCRALGVEFLAEAKQRLGGNAGGLLDEAAEHYNVVAENLGPINQRCVAANTQEVDHIDRDLTLTQLTRAREAEAKGMRVLEKIVAAL